MNWRIQMGDIYNFFVCLSSMYFISFQFNLRNVSAVDWRIQTGDIDKWFNSETRTRNRDNKGGSTLKMLKGIFKTIFWIVFVNIRPEVKRRRRKNTFFDRWANMDVLRSMLCWYKKEIRQWMQGGELGYSAIRSYAGEPSITLPTARYIHHLLHILAKEKDRISIVLYILLVPDILLPL